MCKIRTRRSWAACAKVGLLDRPVQGQSHSLNLIPNNNTDSQWVSVTHCVSQKTQYYHKHVHRRIRPCPHGKFANHSQTIVYVLRRIARFHTGETGTNIPAGFERPRRDMERAGAKRSRAVDFVLWMFDRRLAPAREYLP